jgi:glutaredoxin
MLMMNKVILITLLICSAFLANAQVYKWTDEQDKVHFGDKPPAQDKVESLDEQVLNQRGNRYAKTASMVSITDLYRNKRSDKVVMYTTSSCGYCAKARKHFTENNISYLEKNIDSSSQYKHEFKKLKGKGVPLIFMGQYQMSGFSVKGFTRRYDKFKAESLTVAKAS